MFPDISITADFDPVVLGMRAIAADVLPEVAAIALTRTAIDVMDAEDRLIDEKFDRPTPFTRNGLRLYRASKDALAAAVWFKPFDGAERHYLSPEAFGGTRANKAFEVALRSMGLLPSDMQAVPGEGAHLDQYGNMSGAQLSQLLQYFRSRKGNTRARGVRPARGSSIEYFVGRPGGHAPLGIWQRVPAAGGGASGVKPIVIFVRTAHYRQRLPFRETAVRVVRDRLPVHFAQAWRDVASARLSS